MQKVYIVWFTNENGKHAMWAIYADESKAAEAVRYVKEEFGYDTWCNEEEVR